MKGLFLRASSPTAFYDILKGDWESVLKNNGPKKDLKFEVHSLEDSKE